VPALPVCLLGPVGKQFAVLLPTHPAVVPSHPHGCHRRYVPDSVVFEHVVAALVPGSGPKRIASPSCSDQTIRRCVHDWAADRLAERLHHLILAQYDRMIALDKTDLAVDGCITKALSGRDKADRSPVDHGKQGASSPPRPMPPASRCTSSQRGPTDTAVPCWDRHWRACPTSGRQRWAAPSIWTGPSTTRRAGHCSTRWTSTTKPPARRCRRRSRPGAAEWLSGRRHG